MKKILLVFLSLFAINIIAYADNDTSTTPSQNLPTANAPSQMNDTDNKANTQNNTNNQEMNTDNKETNNSDESQSNSDDDLDDTDDE